MLLKKEILVEGDAEIADSWRKMNRGSIQIDRKRERQAFWLCLEVMRIAYVLSGFSWSLPLRIHASASDMHDCEAPMSSWSWEKLAEMYSWLSSEKI